MNEQAADPAEGFGDAWLGAPDAAAHLGVKRQTLYAYVSRGLLTRRPGPGGRGSLFARAELDRLAARRGHPRAEGPAGGRPAPPELAIVTSVANVVDQQLRYRGHDATSLVGQGFETVAELLWTAALPAERPHWQPDRAVLRATGAVVGRLAAGVSPADRLRVAVLAAAVADPLRVDLRPAAVIGAARNLIAVLACFVGPHPPSGEGPAPATVAGQVAAGLGAEARWRDAIDAALVLLADHELASSTLAARVAASTRADPYQVVSAGLAVLSGPLHGSASTVVVRLLAEAAGPAGPQAAVVGPLRELGSIPGFGHPLYPDGDPRATRLLEVIAAVPGADPAALAVVAAVAELASSRAALYPNIDFALAALVFVAGLPAGSGEAIFALARSAGWVAHALEEYLEAPLRFRVRALAGP